MRSLSAKTRQMLRDLDADPTRLQFPANMPRTFSQYSFQEMRERIEGMNPHHTYKPQHVLKAFPDFERTGAIAIPSVQKVCPVCKLTLRKPQMQGRFKYSGAGSRRAECPRCGCLLEI